MKRLEDYKIWMKQNISRTEVVQDRYCGFYDAVCFDGIVIIYVCFFSTSHSKRVDKSSKTNILFFSRPKAE